MGVVGVCERVVENDSHARGGVGEFDVQIHPRGIQSDHPSADRIRHPGEDARVSDDRVEMVVIHMIADRGSGFGVQGT